MRCKAQVKMVTHLSQYSQCNREASFGSDYCPTHAPERAALREKITALRNAVHSAELRSRDYALLFATAWMMSAEYREYAEKFKFYYEQSNTLRDELRVLTKGRM